MSQKDIVVSSNRLNSPDPMVCPAPGSVGGESVVGDLGMGAVPEGTSVRVRVDLCYDGAPFSGWAKQPGLVTIEGCLEEAARLVLRQDVRYTVAGRTDAGVHADHQVVHFDLPSDVWNRLRGRARKGSDAAPGTPGESFVRKMNGALARLLSSVAPPLRPGSRGAATGSIVIRSAALVPAGFDARFSAMSRSYVYRIADGLERQGPLNRTTSYWTRSALDVDTLNRAGERLLGLHDFLSFCKPRPGATTIRDLKSVRFERTVGGLIEARIRADAFCHNMVRSIIGSCVSVAEGKRDLAWLDSRIAVPVRDSSVRLAPPEGLVLESITYPSDPADWATRAEQTRARREADH
ncbi:tRNA pseudouridine synthase A [Rothia uropygioeca]|uniref:tRNA pseudouridine synthase A n=1 Tax=Kocuria sp. 257 TaxID=2021970 RepID=UPI001EDF5EDD|nr:tRNA pseudouridine synthase A [Kocuria sp. 257]